MKTSEIRDKLLTERALYQQSVKESDAAIEVIRNTLQIVSQQDLSILSTLGVDYENLQKFDLNRMKQDRAYVDECQQYLDNIIHALHHYLEESLNV